MPSPSSEQVNSASSQLKTQIYRAGAGAGKTTTLVRKVIATAREFKENHGRYPQMVVTTFTRKATQELRERLMFQAQTQGDHELLEYVLSAGGLHISTIHGVLSLFLKRFAHKLNLDPEFKTLDQKETLRLVRDILRTIIVNERNFDQLVEDYGFQRLSDLLLSYYRQSMETPAAAPLARPDFEALLEIELQKIGSSIEGYLSLLSSESGGLQAGYEKWLEFGESLKEIKVRLNVVHWETERSHVLEILDGLRKPPFNAAKSKVSPMLDERATLAKAAISQIKEDLFDSTLWADFLLLFELFDTLGKKVAPLIKDEKIKRGVFDFGDLETMTAHFLDQDKIYREQEHGVADSFSKEWDYWLIDEYQDTSPLQVKILSKLIGDRPYFVVGDPQQSIYLFRGARKEVFEQKQTEIRTQGGEEWILDTNYRSTAPLLQFFNDFFEGLSSSFLRMKSREDLDSAVIPEGTQPPEVAQIALLSEESDELVAIVSQIQKLLEAGAQPQEVCVLGRTNRQLQKIADELDASQISYQLHAATGFVARRETKDALLVLKFLVNPNDDLNFFGLLRSPWYFVTDTDLAQLRTKSQLTSVKGSFWTQATAIYESGGLVDRPQVAEVIQRLTQARARCREVGVSAVFYDELLHSGCFDLGGLYDSTGLRESNLWKLVTRLRTEESKMGFNYLQFIYDHESAAIKGEEVSDSDAIPALEPNRVQLMTVHSSKGLQFGHVLLPFMGKRSQLSKKVDWTWDEETQKWAIPLIRGEPPEPVTSLVATTVRDRLRVRELEEADRLLYVALTRAKNSVFLSAVEPAESNSWLSRLNWNLSEGLHSRGNYRYRVQREGWVKAEAKRAAAEDLQVRPLFDDQSERFTLRRELSVTERATLAADANFARKSSDDDPQKSLRQIVPRIEKSVFGVTIHQLLESLKYQSAEKAYDLADQWFGDRAEPTKAALKYLLNLTVIPFQEILDRGFVEWSFSLKLQEEVLRGQIDLWGEVDGTVWIIDYKTGSSEHLEKAFFQLSLYSLALRRFLKVKPGQFRLAVIYPFEQDAFERPAPSEAEVISLLFSQTETVPN